jgi:N-ethylmaleimide reductase
MSLLFSKTSLGSLSLQNRIVMSPMTRSRATDNIPNDLMREYYSQRASVGLIVTEGTSPSPNGLGYPRIPGAYSAAQFSGWNRVVDAVHARGAKIFLQLMHCLAPSAIAAAGHMYTDAQGNKPLPVPLAMNDDDIGHAIAEFVHSAQDAVNAGFDGIEIHGANGYLLEQFIRPTSNTRRDRYGGPIEGRAAFVLQVVESVINAVGAAKVGIRLSPFGVFNDVPVYPGMAWDYEYLARELNLRHPAYIHLVDHSSMGTPPVPDSIKQMFRGSFKGTLILSGGYDAKRAENDLSEGKADLIAVGRPVLANPDLVERWKHSAPLNSPHMDTFYTPGPKGYVDYPSLQR